MSDPTLAIRGENDIEDFVEYMKEMQEVFRDEQLVRMAKEVSN